MNDLATRDEIRKAIDSKKQQIQSDNPQVEIAKMNIEAVGKLADDRNDVFSQLQKDTLQDETLDYAMAINFAVNPLSGLEERLSKRGIKEKVMVATDLGEVEEERAITIKIPMFIGFLKEFLVRRHCLNRSRVGEYIDALDKANGKETIFKDENRRMGILQRMG